jgi:hypothetical protein
LPVPGRLLVREICKNLIVDAGRPAAAPRVAGRLPAQDHMDANIAKCNRIAQRTALPLHKIDVSLVIWYKRSRRTFSWQKLSHLCTPQRPEAE